MGFHLSGRTRRGRTSAAGAAQATDCGRGPARYQPDVTLASDRALHIHTARIPGDQAIKTKTLNGKQGTKQKIRFFSTYI